MTGRFCDLRKLASGNLGAVHFAAMMMNLDHPVMGQTPVIAASLASESREEQLIEIALRPSMINFSSPFKPYN
ncbi:hypothetical protein [Novosphingobium sp. PhB165]|uniref:hypothetical protein n=1 Tax=Novosphingobium sp. PhB165 TaxID=2485105 RepID=UPI00104D8F0F|nr:hypothetical protein [Novosphingobium sp. PhB165]